MPRRRRDDDPPRRRSLAWLWATLGALTVGLVVCVAGCAGAWWLWADARKKAEAARTYPEMTADALIADWQANPVRAADNYAKTGVTVRGKLDEANENWVFQDFIDLGELTPTRQFFSPRAHIFITSDKVRAGLRPANVGDIVTIKCVGTRQATDIPYLEAVEVVKIEPQPVKVTPTRDEFAKLVVGKTEAELIAALGKPDRTSPVGDDTWWHYDKAAKDPVTGKVDLSTTVVVRDGKAVRVLH
jgi:hypothetical protein